MFTDTHLLCARTDVCTHSCTCIHTRRGEKRQRERRERMLAAASVTKNTMVLIPSFLSKQCPTPSSPQGLSEARYP